LKHFEVAIIGGGIYGSSIAYFLSQQGIPAVLLEQGVIGAEGATACSGGIVRVYDPDPVLAQFSLFGTIEWSAWSAYGYPGMSPYSNAGCLYRLSPTGYTRVVELTDTLKGIGYRYEAFSGSRLQSRFPQVIFNTHDEVIWEPGSGYGNPRLAARNLAEGSCLQGATIYENCLVKGFDQCGNKWSIELLHGSITADIIILATGAFGRQLLPDLPVFTRSISLLQLSKAGTGCSVNYPIVDEILETYTRPVKDGGIYCGTQVFEDVKNPGELSSYGQPEKEDAWMRVQKLIQPEYIGLPVNGFKGFDCYTPDKRPLVGFVSGLSNFFIAIGFSGRGFKYCLPLAKAITWQICDRLGKTATIANFDLYVCRLSKQFNCHYEAGG
jgi:glycine/D-amino acid oxidase-like deaminating enzyme